MSDGFIGRAVIFTWDGAVIPGVREKGVSLNGEPIDVTSDENNGWRKLLTEAGQNQVDLSLSGVTKSRVFRQAWFSGQRTKVATIEYPDGDIITAEFYLGTYNETGPYNDAMTFESTVQSSGVVTYTAGLGN